MALIAELADAVKDALNGHAFSVPFTAVRTYLPENDREALAELSVWVVPRSRKVARETRAESNHSPVIDVGVQKAVDPKDNAQMDALVALAEEIGDYLLNNRLASMPNAACMGIENDPMAAPEHLIENRVFTSVISASYQIRR